MLITQATDPQAIIEMQPILLITEIPTQTPIQTTITTLIITLTTLPITTVEITTQIVVMLQKPDAETLTQIPILTQIQEMQTTQTDLGILKNQRIIIRIGKQKIFCKSKMNIEKENKQGRLEMVYLVLYGKMKKTIIIKKDK